MTQNAFQREHIVEQIQSFFRGVHDISDFYYRLYLLNGLCKICDGRGYERSQSEPCPQCYASGKADRWQTAPTGRSEPITD
jgi:DnaJ-class molecular chaperone